MIQEPILSFSLSAGILMCHFLQVKQMLIALLCESEMKLADETVEIILDKVSPTSLCIEYFSIIIWKNLVCAFSIR